MSKKKELINLIIIVIVIALFIVGIIFGIINTKKHFDKVKAEERYTEIKDSVKKGVEWMLGAQYPRCSISKEFKGTESYHSSFNSSYLINQGYIKKDELLDVDEKSYCDVYVRVNEYFENFLDQQQNCEVYYKIYLKCKDYEDKGYKDRGH